jgi:glycerophosphoryl diester phosphodiesterase
MTIRGVAHRGYSAKHPENTLSAFKAALDHKFSHVELDVHLSRDGVPVVIHDYSVDRVTNHSGLVRDFTVAELQQMVVFGTERVPTLDEALSLLRGEVTIMIELKQAGHYYPGLEHRVLAALKRTDTYHQALVISFDHFSVARLRELDSKIQLGLTSTSAMPYVFEFMSATGCSHLGVPTKMLTPEYDEMIVDRGYTVGPWMVDTAEEMNFIAKNFPHALITTNEVERWADFYRARPELQAL